MDLSHESCSEANSNASTRTKKPKMSFWVNDALTYLVGFLFVPIVGKIDLTKNSAQLIPLDAGQRPFSFQIGKGAVIKGWDEGVIGMQIGKVARLLHVVSKVCGMKV
ncbi:unnamed protein product [Brassica oleracea]